MSSQVLLLLVFCGGVSFILSYPLHQKSGHFFVFWKTTSQELLPKLDYIQKKTQRLILEYFQTEMVSKTPGNDDTMDSAKELYNRLNLTKFPSQRVLERDNKTQFIFIKGLLKENYRLCYAYSKVLLNEREFRCKDGMSKQTCSKTKEIERGLSEVTEALKEQLMKFFLVKRIPTDFKSKRERKIIAYFSKEKQADKKTIANFKSLEMDYDIDADYDVNPDVKYRRRNKATVGLLYAVYIHLKDSDGTLRYALRLLQPSDHVE